jgi:hypothetical protein
MKTISRSKTDKKLIQNLNPFSAIDGLTLESAYHSLDIDKDTKIPFIIWLLENPDSPLALPGNINLFHHDCLHLLLSRGFSLEDEAFVIGFTMGNSTKVKPFHLSILKVFSTLFYPKSYRFNQNQLRSFEWGCLYGKRVATKNINELDFKDYCSETIHHLRRMLSIDTDELKKIWQVEQMLMSYA